MWKTDTATSYGPLASVWKGNTATHALRFTQRGMRFGSGSDSTSAPAFQNLMVAFSSSPSIDLTGYRHSETTAPLSFSRSLVIIFPELRTLLDVKIMGFQEHKVPIQRLQKSLLSH
ncbi:MAG: hypothetical protein AAGB13_18005 [Cyanobacteria bacterium P01_F01_bin.33]